MGGATSIARCSSPNSSVSEWFWKERQTSFHPGEMSALWKRRQADARNRKRGTKCEHASFTPLVLSACGGLATGASTFYKRLASLLAEKWEQPYSITVKEATLPIMPSHLSVACIACIDLH